jgi:hypothetical protein
MPNCVGSERSFATVNCGSRGLIGGRRWHHRLHPAKAVIHHKELVIMKRSFAACDTLTAAVRAKEIVEC